MKACSFCQVVRVTLGSPDRTPGRAPTPVKLGCVLDLYLKEALCNINPVRMKKKKGEISLLSSV